MDKLLVVGANGFLGSEIIKAGQREYEIVGTVRAGRAERLSGATVKIVDLSLESLDSLFTKHKFHAVINTAVNYGINNDSIAEIIETNTLLPLRLYERAQSSNVPLVLNFDTFYSKQDFNYSHLERYQISKRHLGQWARTVCSGPRFISLRLEQIYGPSDSPKKNIMNLVSQIVSGATKIDLTSGEQKRDFLYVSDAAKAAINVCRTFYKFPQNFSEYEIGTGKSISLRAFLETVKAISNSSTKLEFGALSYRDGEIMDSRANVSQFAEVAEWSPQISLEDGIRKIVNSI